MSKQQYSGDRRGTPWYDERITPEIPLEQLDREAIPDHALVNSRMREQRAADGQGRTPGNFSGGPSPEQGPLVPIATMDPEVRNAIDAQDNAIDEQEVTIDKLRKDVDRWMDDLEKRGDETSDNEAAIKALQATLAEQSAIITGQRAAIEALRGWVQERADGVSNLGMRVAKLEDMRARLGGVLAVWMRATNAQLHRLLWGHPALEQQTTSERQAVTRLESTITQYAAQDDRNERLDNYQSRLNRLERQAHRVREQFPSVGEPTPAQALAAIGLEEAPQSTGKPTAILITRKGLDVLKTTAREGDDE